MKKSVNALLCAMLLLLTISAAWAQLAFRAASTATPGVAYRSSGALAEGTGANVTPGLPGGWLPGDLLVLVVLHSGGDNQISAPSLDWTPLRRGNNNGQNIGAAVFYKIATASVTAPTVTKPGGDPNSVLMARIMAFSGVSAVSPIQDSSINLNSNDSTTDADAVSGGMAGAAMVVVTSHINDACVSAGSPGGSWTAAFESSTTTGDNGTLAAHYRTQATAGNQSSLSFARTGCTNDDAYAIQFVINAGLSIPVPSGTQAGDVMLATLAARPSGTTFTAPSGWTALADTTQSNDITSRMATYWRIATSSEPSSYAWGLGGPTSTGVVGNMASFSGADESGPIDVSASALTGSGYSHQAPSVTTTVDNTMLVTAHEFTSSPGNWTPPSGMTEAVDMASQARPSTTGISMEVNYQAITAAGATGTRTATASSSGTDAGYGITRSVALKPLIPVTLLADWQMDQAAWTGAANEVIDSSGNGYHGFAANAGGGVVATTSSGSPAYTSGSQNTCKYGLFDAPPARSLTYVQLGSFPGLPAQFTFAAWIRSTDVSVAGQRILVNDDGQDGWGLSLGDSGSGKLRLFNRNISNSGAVTGDGSDGSCGLFCIDSNAVVTSNAWYFVAATVNTSTKDVVLYVFDSGGVRKARVTGKYGGTWSNGSGAVAIGGETAASSEGQSANFHFRGNIDEVRVLSPALSETQLQTQLQRVRTCPSLDHVEFVHDGNALTCMPEPITVLGCTSSASCYLSAANQSGDTFSVALNTPAGAQWCSDAACVTPITGSVTLSSGAVIYLREPTAATVAMGGTATPATNATVQCRNTTSNLIGSGSACNVTYAASGLLLNAANHVSCTAQTITIQAVKANDTATACIPAFANANRDLSLYLSYLNPATGTKSASLDYVTSSGGATSSIASLSTSSGAPTTLSGLYWDATGKATLKNLSYPDVGQVQLNPAVASPGGATLTAVSGNQFIAAPARFSFTTLPSSPIKAGEDFSLSVSAMNACSPNASVAPNFGKETPAENATLSFDSRVAPTGTNNISNGPSDGTYSGTVTSWTSGIGSSTDSHWSEVGQTTLKATLASGSYLGSGLTATGTSSTIGNFVPAYFNTDVVQGCSNLFSYSGQPFKVTVTAKNKAGNTTVNYSNLPGCSVCSKSVTLSNAGDTTGFNGTNTIPASSFGYDAAVAGSGGGIGIKRTVTYTFPTMPATLPAIPMPTLALRATDGTASSSGHTEDTTQIRQGRLRLSNAFGSEKQPLQMAVRTEYWNGNTWILNSDDSCTALTTVNIYKASATPAITASAVSVINGTGVLLLTPTTTATGSVDIAAHLGTSGNDQSCLASHGGTPANLSWLRSQNGSCASTYDRDPSARATFGIYAPETQRVFHVRELF